MDYKEILSEDSRYKEIVNTFQRKKTKLEAMAGQGLYKKEHLQAVAQKLHAELKENIAAYNQSKLDALQAEISAMENKNQKVGLGERSDDVKEFEMLYKLANDYELQNMVQDLDTKDLLEANLLRSELKNRNLEELDLRVRQYINNNIVGVGGFDEETMQKYEDLKYKLGVFYTWGGRSLPLGDEIIPVDHIGDELIKTANMVVNDKSIVRDVDIAAF